MERTLNISEPQVLFHYPADPNGLEYHQRVLVHKIGQGRWVVLSPDLELSVEDLTQQRHVVLSRHSPFPPHLLPSDPLATFLMSSPRMSWSGRSVLHAQWAAFLTTQRSWGLLQLVGWWLTHLLIDLVKFYRTNW